MPPPCSDTFAHILSSQQPLKVFLAMTCLEIGICTSSRKSAYPPEASIVQGPSRPCSLLQKEEESLSALGLPRGGAHKGVAPVKKKKKKIDRGKTQQKCCAFWVSPGT